MARVVRTTVVAASLTAKGMKQDESHHHMFRKTVDGVTTLVTRMSHGMKEINDSLAGLMAKQCCLFLGEFWQLVDCPSEADWNAKVAGALPGWKNPFLGR